MATLQVMNFLVDGSGLTINGLIQHNEHAICAHVQGQFLYHLLAVTRQV